MNNLTIEILGPLDTTLKTAGFYCDKNIKITLSGAENITPQNIKSGVTILGVTGSYGGEPSSDPIPDDKRIQNLILGGSTPKSTITFPVGYYEKQPTLNLSLNNTLIKSSNIKKDITILGITGTVEEITEEQLQALEAL